MKEIKEILDKCTPFLFGDEVDKLLDYITNLQEENKKLKDRIHALEEHNKHLNKEAQKYFGMDMDREYAVKDTYDTANDVAWELFKEKEELESIINNVVKYLGKQTDYFTDYPLVNRKHLLNILKGEDSR